MKIRGLFADGIVMTQARRPAMKKKYIVTLTEEERSMLREMVSRGKAAARKLMHARILLKADAGEGGPAWHDDAIAEGLDVGRATVERVRKEFVEDGLEAALERRKPRRQYARKRANCGLRIDPQRTIIPGVTPRNLREARRIEEFPDETHTTCDRRRIRPCPRRGV
jgi:hypothetical protein